MNESSAQRTSATLLGRLRQNATDQSAWEEFVRRYSGQIGRWCQRWGLQEADTQDVTQTVLARLSQKLRTFQYDPQRSFRAYLKTLTRYAWRDLQENQRHAGAARGGSQLLMVLQSVEAREDLLKHLHQEFDQELLEEATERVRLRVEPHTWEAFRLTALEGQSGTEAAQHLGIKVATVFKAKSKVQKMLQEEIQRLEQQV
jgi:RNA polymerase sigma factor (sigma-70 family)